MHLVGFIIRNFVHYLFSELLRTCRVLRLAIVAETFVVYPHLEMIDQNWEQQLTP